MGEIGDLGGALLVFGAECGGGERPHLVGSECRQAKNCLALCGQETSVEQPGPKRLNGLRAGGKYEPALPFGDGACDVVAQDLLAMGVIENDQEPAIFCGAQSVGVGLRICIGVEKQHPRVGRCLCNPFGELAQQASFPDTAGRGQNGGGGSG